MYPVYQMENELEIHNFDFKCGLCVFKACFLIRQLMCHGLEWPNHLFQLIWFYGFNLLLLLNTKSHQSPIFFVVFFVSHMDIFYRSGPVDISHLQYDWCRLSREARKRYFFANISWKNPYWCPDSNPQTARLSWVVSSLHWSFSCPSGSGPLPDCSIFFRPIQEASALGYLAEAEDKRPKSRFELDQSLYGLKELCSHHSLHYCPILQGLLGWIFFK